VVHFGAVLWFFCKLWFVCFQGYVETEVKCVLFIAPNARCKFQQLDLMLCTS